MFVIHVDFGANSLNLALLVTLFLAGAAVVGGFLYRAIRLGSFDRDEFPSTARKQAALALLILTLFLSVVAPFALGLAGRPADPRSLTPVSAFALHFIFVSFLVAYYFLSGRKPLADFLMVRTGHPIRLLAAGFPIAAFAWGASIAGMLAIRAALSLFSSPSGAPPEISPVIPWIIKLSFGFKLSIVVSAMVFEEAFFRSFLQPRIGAVGATLCFALAHGVYGQPAMLVGIFILAAVLAVTFELYQNVLPAVVAHGAFDAFEIFVLIPFVLKFAGG
jgi:membrane protease YdiL (CAAX protease family)